MQAGGGFGQNPYTNPYGTPYGQYGSPEMAQLALMLNGMNSNNGNNMNNINAYLPYMMAQGSNNPDSAKQMMQAMICFMKRGSPRFFQETKTVQSLSGKKLKTHAPRRGGVLLFWILLKENLLQGRPGIFKQERFLKFI